MPCNHLSLYSSPLDPVIVLSLLPSLNAVVMSQVSRKGTERGTWAGPRLVPINSIFSRCKTMPGQTPKSHLHILYLPCVLHE
ncbi:hypothetical protein EV127DRAFT_44536 [Xylaria flabelliformis]|nr:hypothetical protein EV127DRAFT_44536 [Xylaria flabelliformis]KAI0860307.1 hypothetical protein F4860DRAFT_479914 [Xylaria cubensis]